MGGLVREYFFGTGKERCNLGIVLVVSRGEKVDHSREIEEED